MREIPTPHGTARVTFRTCDDPRAALVLGHGAGGGVGAPDLVAAADAALSAQFMVALVEQPYRVAGRRSPAPAHHLDAAWVAVIRELRRDELAGLPLVAGGRSSGARVACRTASEAGAVGVLCLAFPLRPPTRAGGPERPSRIEELDAVAVPVLVVQGSRDPFGVPPEGANRRVAEVAGNHSLRTGLDAIRAEIVAWLGALLG